MSRRVLWALPAPLILLALWHVAVRQGWMTIIPVPADVSLEIWDFAIGGVYAGAHSGTLLVHLWATTSRVLTGFGLAAAAAVPLGVLMGRSRVLSALLEPTVSLMRPVPVTAWVPLVLIVFGLGARATVILVFIAAFYPILVNTIVGVKAVPVRLVEAAEMLGTGRLRMLSSVVVPASLPAILTGMRVALGFAWVVVVVGETTGVTTGLGAVITEAREISNTGLIIAGMAFIGLAGFASDKLVTLAFRLARRNRPLTATA